MPTRMPWHGLRAVQQRLQWKPPFQAQVLLLGEVDEHGLIKCVQHSLRKVGSRKTTKTPTSRERDYETFTSRRRQLLDDTSSSTDSGILASRTKVNAAGEIFVLSGAAHPTGYVTVTDGVYQLPFTLSALASRVRSEALNRIAPSPHLLAASSSPPHLRLEGRSIAAAASSLTDLTRTTGLCAPQSKDCVILELATFNALSLGDALTVAVHQLRRNGSLLVFSPEHVRIPPQGIEYLTWQFASQRLGYLSDGATFLFCSCLTGSGTAPRLRQSDFPGFLPKGVRRKRHWDRYGRNRDLYVANLAPDFGNALFSKDTLEAELRRKHEQTEAFDERDNAFFGVSHDMVEKNRYASKPED